MLPIIRITPTFSTSSQQTRIKHPQNTRCYSVHGDLSKHGGWATTWRSSFRHKTYSHLCTYILLVSLFVWIDRAQFFCGNSHDPKEGLWTVNSKCFAWKNFDIRNPQKINKKIFENICLLKKGLWKATVFKLTLFSRLRFFKKKRWFENGIYCKMYISKMEILQGYPKRMRTKRRF